MIKNKEHTTNRMQKHSEIARATSNLNESPDTRLVVLFCHETCTSRCDVHLFCQLRVLFNQDIYGDVYRCFLVWGQTSTAFERKRDGFPVHGVARRCVSL